MREIETGLEEALRKHVEVLTVGIGPRTAFRSDSLARAQRYIAEVFEEVGLEVAEQAYDYQGRRVANVIATPPGAAAAAYYIVGAHYDTVPSTPGADDNASAVAVMLELARRLVESPPVENPPAENPLAESPPAESPPAAPVRFVAFTLEEAPAFMTGHQGSRVFVQAAKGAGDRVLGAIVLEMVGYTCPRQHYPLVLRWAGYPGQGNFIGIVGNWRSRRFGRAVVKGFRKNPRLPVESLFMPFDGRVLPATRLSDHASFWDAGWPALMVTDTAFFRNPNYHLPSDTLETLDFGFMAALVESLALAAAELPRAAGVVMAGAPPLRPRQGPRPLDPF